MPLRPIRAERRQPAVAPPDRGGARCRCRSSSYWSHVTERGQRLERARRRAPRRPQTRERDAGTNIGFVDQRRLDEHYEKHGAEFGRITKQDYLHQAQLLRDAAVGGPVLQTVRADGVTTRFDRQTGAFIAFNPQRHDPYLLQAATTANATIGARPSEVSE